MVSTSFEKSYIILPHIFAYVRVIVYLCKQKETAFRKGYSQYLLLR